MPPDLHINKNILYYQDETPEDGGEPVRSGQEAHKHRDINAQDKTRQDRQERTGTGASPAPLHSESSTSKPSSEKKL